jgi:hypothetical protein
LPGVQGVLFLLVCCWLWFSCGTFASTSPTQCPRFEETFEGLLPATSIKMFSNQGAALRAMRWICFRPLANLGFVLWSTFGRASWFGLVIEACKTSRFPGLKPRLDGATVDWEDRESLWSSRALQTASHTRRPWSDTLMLTVCVYSL